MSRISATLTPRECSAALLAPDRRLWSGFRAERVSPLWVALTNDTLRAERTRAMDLEGLIAEARERRPQPMPSRERKVAVGMGVTYLAAAAAVGAAVAPT